MKEKQYKELYKKMYNKASKLASFESEKYFSIIKKENKKFEKVFKYQQERTKTHFNNMIKILKLRKEIIK